MAITRGWLSMRESAFRTTAPNSRSTSTTLLWACWKMKAMASASSRVLMVLSTAPLMGTPKCASNMAGTLGATMETVSPSPMPRRRRAEASWRQRRSVWAQLWRRGPWISAG